MKNPLNKKLRGFQKAPRERFKLLRDGLLTVEELMLYEFYIAITDWDVAHNIYGKFQTTDDKVAKIMGWNSRSTVCIHRNRLLKKKFLVRDEDGLFSPKDFEDWELRKSGKISKNDVLEIEQLDENIVEKNEHQVLENQQDVSESKQNQVQNDDYTLGSSKGKFSNRASRGSLSAGELEEISRAIDIKESAENSGSVVDWVNKIVDRKSVV